MKMHELPFEKQPKHLTFHRGVYQTFCKINSAAEKSQLGGSLIFWRKKSRGIGLHTQNPSSKAMTIATRGVYTKSLLVTKHGYTTMNLREQHRAEHGCPKEETHLKSQREMDLTNSSVHIFLELKRNCAQKSCEEKGITGKYLRFCAYWGQHFYFMIMHLLTSASSCRSMLWMRILKLCFTLPPPLTLHFVTFQCSNITKKSLSGQRFNWRASLGSDIFQHLSHVLKIQFQ